MKSWTLVYDHSIRKRKACARPSAPWETGISPPGALRLNPKRARFITRARILPGDTTG
jgi:hypothetical protein